MREVTTVREALEAEAQEVAQLAVEAVQAVNAAREKVQETASKIESGKQQEAALTKTLETLRAKLSEVSQANAEPIRNEITISTETLASLRAELSSLRAHQAELEEKVSAAAAAAAKAEEVAAAAMQAAETAVKEEIQAVAVVNETQKALEKAFSAISSEPPKPAAAAPAPAAPAPAATPAAAASTAAAAAAATPAEAPATPSRTLNLAFWGALALGALVGNWALGNTAAGQAAVSAFASVLDVVKDKVAHIHIHEAERALLEAILLLATSIICVPLVVTKVPGGNPVLGYLLGGALVGPYAFGLISDVQSVKHLAELGVVFLLFNIGLELSLDRLQSMAKMVFGMGTLQVVLTLLGVAAVAMSISSLPGPSAVILGGALAMSSTAVGIQVLEDRGEMGSFHGRAIFSVLLLQDLAVVVLLMLIPLLAPSPDGATGGMAKIAQALGTAAVKAVVCIFAIIAGGRLLIQPLYKKISSMANAEIFAATTLLVVLGTSFLTSLAGLSLALGAFLAGLLIAETEYALQVESDIAPYKGLLLGLFFMSVGMEISGQLFLAKWKEVIAGIVVLIAGKLAVMAAIGPMFGLSKLASLRAGLLLAPGGEFAFVAFGVAVGHNVLPANTTAILYLVVALSMALTPYLAALGGKLGQLLEKNDTKALQPKMEETKELQDHVIIMGYGRSGQLIAQLLSENLIPFVAIDVQTDRVATGRAQDLPVYFGDAGSPAVLHLLGAERAACAIIAMDTPGANYRAVYAMNKHFPQVKTYVRAHDLNHAVNLEKAGATAVVPETLEPSLQLAAAVLSTLEFQRDEVSRIVDDFRRQNILALEQLTQGKGTSIGYGYTSPISAQKTDASSTTSGSSGAGSGPAVSPMPA